MDYDLKIVGGTLVDGTGKPAFQGDVGIKNGRIVALGEAPARAARTIEANDRVVAPGFVDIHTHYDAQVLWDPLLSISPWHGVTTVVMGNCGFGVAPTRPAHRELILRTLEKVEGMSLDALEAGCGRDWPFETFPQYLDFLERRGLAVNAGVLMGHTPLRLHVMGEAATERAASDEEVAEMRRLLQEGLAAGAVGFATSKAGTHVGYDGRPVPSRLAQLDEIFALASVLGEQRRGVIQATVGRELYIDEFARLARQTGRPITWTALLAGFTLGGASHADDLARSQKLAEEGLPVYPQVSPRALNFEFQFSAPFPFEPMSVFKAVAAADRDGKKRIYADPEFRDAFHARIAQARGGFDKRFALTVISQCAVEPALEERRLADVARERGKRIVDLALDLALATDLQARFRMPVANHEEDEVLPLLQSPCTVIGLSDAGAHASQLCDACLPTYMLQRWVREKRAIPLEKAVHMLTGRTAEVFGLADRGLLAPGRPADIVVFDPDSVGCTALRRVHDLPAGADRLVSQAIGIDHVLVNGVPVREANRDAVSASGPLPGRVLRGGRTN
ncbi:MAG: amidohydrolase family protein [Alphaproteobacteria bacterium]|nr:amidohydrolase family protein [Alphaproteobacteria bacterium]